MKSLALFLIWTSIIFSNTMESYNIELKQIESLEYDDNAVILNLKKEYWKNIFEFSNKNIYKKVNLFIDNILIAEGRHIISPLYNGIEFIEGKEIREKLKLQLSKIDIVKSKTTAKEKVDFFNKMLDKYPNNYFLRQELISIYHDNDTLASSQLCIDIYEETKGVLKEKLNYNYLDIFDCYMDLNNTKKMFEFLDETKQYINDIDQYILLELEAFLYASIDETDKSQKLYVEALQKLEKTDFIKMLTNPDESIIGEMNEMKKKEIERLKGLFK